MVSACSFSPTLYTAAISLFASRAAILVLSIAVLFTRKTVAESLRLPPGKVVSSAIVNITASRAYFLDASLTVAVSQLDVILLGYFAVKAEVGIYGAGSRFVALFLAVPWMITNVAVPSIMHATNQSDRDREVWRLRTTLIGVAALAAVSLGLLAPLLTSRLLGPAFGPLLFLWPFFSILVVVRFLESGLGIMMLVRGKVVSRAFAQLMSLTIILSAGSGLTILWGAKGLIVALMAASAAVSLYYHQQLSAPPSSDKALRV